MNTLSLTSYIVNARLVHVWIRLHKHTHSIESRRAHAVLERCSLRCFQVKQSISKLASRMIELGLFTLGDYCISMKAKTERERSPTSSNHSERKKRSQYRNGKLTWKSINRHFMGKMYMESWNKKSKTKTKSTCKQFEPPSLGERDCSRASAFPKCSATNARYDLQYWNVVQSKRQSIELNQFEMDFAVKKANDGASKISNEKTNVQTN